MYSMLNILNISDNTVALHIVIYKMLTNYQHSKMKYQLRSITCSWYLVSLRKMV